MRSLDLALLIAALSVASASVAQEEPTTPTIAVESEPPAETTLDTITVTAQKREEDALDVPLSVQAFSGGCRFIRTATVGYQYFVWQICQLMLQVQDQLSDAGCFVIGRNDDAELHTFSA